MQDYDDSLSFILKNGKRVKNRTGIDTLTVTSVKCVYDIGEYFPLITKRKIFPKAAFAELLWMLSGSTNNDDLIQLGCNFWTPWVEFSNPDNKKFYEKTGFPYGYLGPVYGWQMRHFGGDYYRYVFAGEDLGGVDQISWLINQIREDPYSRSHIVSMWNPKDLSLMRLRPCHYSFNIKIDDEGKMTLILNQRSADFPVGVPHNIQFYSALCYMISQQTGYTPYRFIHNCEDAHIYVNQVEQIEEYLSRKEIPSPKLIVNKRENIFSYQVDDFRIMDYHPLSTIKMNVAV